MKREKVLKQFLFVAVAIFVLFVNAGKMVYANSSNYYQEIEGSAGTNSNITSSPNNEGYEIEKKSTAVTDSLKNFNLLNDENMAKANKIASPLVNAIGYLVGILIVAFPAIQIAISAIDCYYLGVAFTRKYLDGSNGGKQLVSDEAIKALMLSGAQTMQDAQQMAGGQIPMSGAMFGRGGVGAYGRPMGGFGSPMGGFGSPMGSPMGGYGNPMGSPMGMSPMGANGQQEQPQPKPNKKLAITIYFKMRIVFVVVSFVALIVLTSSLLLGFGINIAELINGIGAKFAG